MKNDTLKPKEKIDRTQKKLESRLLAAIERVEMGRDDALAHLGEQRSALREAAQKAAQRIETLSDQADEQLKELQKHLGELNYELAEEKEISDLKSFDARWERLSAAVSGTIEELAQLEAKGLEAGGAGSRVERAWWEFAAAVELARTHLAEAASESSLELERGRRQLADHLRDLQAKAEDPERFRESLEKLEKLYGQFKHVAKAMMLDPDEAVPQPEKEAK